MVHRMWTYFARDAVPSKDWAPEPGVEFLILNLDELFALARDGTFDHGPHLAIPGMAMLEGLAPQLCGMPSR